MGAFQETVTAHAKVLKLGQNVLGESFGSREGREIRGVARIHQVGSPCKEAAFHLICGGSALQFLTKHLYMYQSGNEPLENLVERVCWFNCTDMLDLTVHQ